LTQFLLIRPWDHDLLELPDDVHSIGDYTPPGSPANVSPGGSSGEHELIDSERALRLIVRLGQPFSAFLLKRDRRGECERFASDHRIIAQFEGATCVPDMEVRILGIL